MPLLTEHFSVQELTVTQQVGPDGRLLANHPGDTELLYLLLLCERALEPIRVLWGCPVRVTSGYRGPQVERAIQERAGLIRPGGELAPSQHRRGQAADIVPANPDLSVYEAFRRIQASGVPYDQLLLEGRPGHEWIHVSIAPVMYPPRREALVSADGVHFSPYQPPKEGTA